MKLKWIVNTILKFLKYKVCQWNFISDRIMLWKHKSEEQYLAKQEKARCSKNDICLMAFLVVWAPKQVKHTWIWKVIFLDKQNFILYSKRYNIIFKELQINKNILCHVI